jgi:hypothetical protein
MTGRLARAGIGTALALVCTIAAIACFTLLPGCLGAGDDFAIPLGSVDAGDAGDSRPPDGMPSEGGMLDGTTRDGGGDGAVSDAAPTLQDGPPATTGGSAQFNSAPLDVGTVDCGSAKTQTFQIKNTGTGRLGVAAMTVGSGFQVSPSSLSVNPGGTGTLSITATIMSSKAAGSTVVGSLNLFTTDPSNANVAIHLSATASGATLAFGQGGNNPSLGFGTWPVGTPAPSQTITVQNVGNASATISIGSPGNPQFSLSGVPDGGTSFTLTANETRTVTASFTPTGAGAATTTVDVTPSGVICGTSSQSIKQTITLTGAGTVGSIGGYPNKLDFEGSCNGHPPPAKTITLTNTGGAVVNVTSAQFDNPGAGFTVSPGSGTIPGDAGLTFTVNAPSFPGAQNSGLDAGSMPQPITAALKITATGDPATTAPITIPATVNPVGASLNFDVSTVQFNSVSLQGSLASAFNVVNNGNSGSTSAGGVAKVTLALVATGAPDGGAADAQAVAGAPSPFTFDMGQTTTQFTIAAPAQGAQSQQGEDLTFKPVAIGGSYAQILMSVDPSTVLCAPLPPPLPLQGIGSGLSFDSPGLTFYAPCDGKTNPSAPALSLTNTTDASVLWAIGNNDFSGPAKSIYYVASVTSPDGGVDNAPPGLQRTLGPSEVATIDIASTGSMPSARMADGGVTLNEAGMPWNAPHPADLSAQLSIAAQFLPSGANAGPAVIPLDEIPLGDQLSVAIGGVAITSLPSFGPVPVGTKTPPTQTFFVSNNANVAAGAVPPYPGASIVVTSTNPAFSASTPPLLAPDASAPVTVTYTPTILDAGTSTLQVTQQDAGAPLCAPLPAPISVSGGGGLEGLPRIASTDFAGSSPTFDFQLVDCGTTGSKKTLVVSNTGDQPFNVTNATFAATSFYTYTINPAPTPASPVAVSPNTPVSFDVSPTVAARVADPTHSAATGDALTLTTDAYNDAPHVITLHVQAHGAVIVDTVPALRTTWNFGTVASGSVATITNEMQNSGNAPVTVSLAAVSPQVLPSVFGLASNPTTVNAATTTPIVGQFAPTSASGSWIGQGTLTVSGILCEPLPAQWGGIGASDSGTSADGGAGGAVINMSGMSN